MSDTFLELKQIKKNFGGVAALKGVDLTVRRGEIHCLAGENGCGKSTLIKVISGAHDASSGEIYIEGKRIESLTPIEAIHQGIQVIYQDFAVFPNLTVAENIAMNKALMEGNKLINWKEARRLAIDAMKQIGANMDLDEKVERLSVADKQMVAICRAIINDAKLLILDEPTTALTAREVGLLNKIVRNLKKKGMAVVIVNHKLDEIYEIADRLTILRNGENAATGLIEEFSRERFIKCMTGREISNDYYRPQEKDEIILRVNNLYRRNCFNQISFTLKKGDILGITGLLGSGRSELGEALFGVLPIESGTIQLNGKEIQIRNVQDAMKNKIGYVPEDRLTQGLFLNKSIQDNTVASSVKKYYQKGRINYQKMYQSTTEWISKIGCLVSSPKPMIRTLSGGNAQKIVIAKWLNMDPELLILNGPTVGVDIGAKSDIHKILRGLAADGMGIVIISDDLSELIHNCNKLIVMKNGEMSGTLETSELTESKLSVLLGEEDKVHE